MSRILHFGVLRLSGDQSEAPVSRICIAFTLCLPVVSCAVPHIIPFPHDLCISLKLLQPACKASAVRTGFQHDEASCSAYAMVGESA